MREVYRVKQGGLMRCCLASLDDHVVERDEDQHFKEGEILPCKWCKSSMIFTDGAWQWNHLEA